MCWLDLATGHPDIWFSIILGVSVRVLPDEINIGISRLSKADGPCLVWVGLQSFETWIEQKTEEGRICSLCLTVFELGHWFSPTFGLKLEPTSSVLLIPGRWTWTPTAPLSLLGRQLAEGTPWDFSTSLTCVSQFLIISLFCHSCVCVCMCVLLYIHIHMYTIGSVSLENRD